jgi:hypothetical protein
VINSKPKSAVLERMRSVPARQLCDVVLGNLRNIQRRARVWQIEKEAKYQRADLLLLLGIVLGIGESFSTDITLTLNPSLSKELQGENR